MEGLSGGDFLGGGGWGARMWPEGGSSSWLVPRSSNE